ncbi:DNA integrity scanning protein DisA [Phycisphaerae bacterium RAS2]|nr:DNA integrity scanning protein DisA [Phycisphaerae bacterium RAS2]
MEFFRFISDRLPRLVWTDLVELFVIGLVVFWIARFLKGTRGARLLRGFLLLLVGGTLVLNLVANIFDLERIKTIYPFFVGGLFASALVAFQPELRRALIRLGAASFFAEASGSLDRTIDEVTEAVETLAKRGIGAIIAFQRSNELGAMIDAGCKLDSELTRELLVTIFWPGSPLHDMGIVIGQGRILAAAVQFPLTDSDDVAPSLGSRHRAAIGLTNETDAIVIVVSEETKTISLVERGEMVRPLTPDQLRAQLRERLGRPPEPPREEEAEK